MTDLAATSVVSSTADVSPAVRGKKFTHFARNLLLIAGSYLVDGVVLLLFHLAGTISWVPAVVYTSAGLLSCAITYTLIRSGWTQRLADPWVVLPQTAMSQSIQLAALALLPEVGFMFALLLFIVYCSFTMSAPARKSAVAWVIASTGMALVLINAERPLQIPNRNLTEQLIAYGFFAITLWRCVFLGTFNGNMTRLLHKRGLELAKLTAQVDQLAHFDELTGVMNRRSLLAALRDELLRAERSGQSLCIALMDLDHFKLVNDRLGHLAGDRTLRIFAATLSQLTRKADRFGRYGGEEFVLVMPGTGAGAALVPVERMRRGLKAANWSPVAPDFEITFSCGLAVYQPGESMEALLQRADDALYRAKRDGRNCTREG